MSSLTHPPLSALPTGPDDSLAVGSRAVFRSPPHNLQAEKALLGAILANNSAYERVSEFLRGENFYDPIHGRIYEACASLIERGQLANPVTLRTYFESDDALREIGGATYLAELAGSAVTIINTAEYGRIVYDLHLKRQLITLGEDVVNDAYSGEVEATATSQIEAAEQRLYDLATEGHIDGDFVSFKDSLVSALSVVELAHKRDGRLAGVTTGLRDIDDKLGGLHDSDLLILAGRPSMGKTALATNIAYNAAHAYVESEGEGGAVVGFFSLEMSAEQLATRILAERTRVSSDQMRKGKLREEDFQRVATESRTLHHLPLFIDDSPALTVSALRTRARRLKRRHNLGLIVIDYLQLISPSPGSRGDGRVNEVSEITRGLKTLAKELNVPVLALSQLSRAVEQRDDKRPQLSDLRESGSIEQDADVVMFVYRDQYYLERAQPKQHENETTEKFMERMQRWQDRCESAHNLAEVIVAKQRHGPIGAVKLHFEGEFTKFGDHSPDTHLPSHIP